MVGLYYVIQEMGIFPMSVANNFCDMPLPKYIDSKTVLIYRPHPVVPYRVPGTMQSTGVEYTVVLVPSKSCHSVEYRVQCGVQGTV